MIPSNHSTQNPMLWLRSLHVFESTGSIWPVDEIEAALVFLFTSDGQQAKQLM